MVEGCAADISACTEEVKGEMYHQVAVPGRGKKLL